MVLLSPSGRCCRIVERGAADRFCLTACAPSRWTTSLRDLLAFRNRLATRPFLCSRFLSPGEKEQEEVVEQEEEEEWVRLVRDDPLAGQLRLCRFGLRLLLLRHLPALHDLDSPLDRYYRHRLAEQRYPKQSREVEVRRWIPRRWPLKARQEEEEQQEEEEAKEWASLHDLALGDWLAVFRDEEAYPTTSEEVQIVAEEVRGVLYLSVPHPRWTSCGSVADWDGSADIGSGEEVQAWSRGQVVLFDGVNFTVLPRDAKTSDEAKVYHRDLVLLLPCDGDSLLVERGLCQRLLAFFSARPRQTQAGTSQELSFDIQVRERRYLCSAVWGEGRVKAVCVRVLGGSRVSFHYLATSSTQPTLTAWVETGKQLPLPLPGTSSAALPGLLPSSSLGPHLETVYMVINSLLAARGQENPLEVLEKEVQRRCELLRLARGAFYRNHLQSQLHSIASTPLIVPPPAPAATTSSCSSSDVRKAIEECLAESRTVSQRNAAHLLGRDEVRQKCSSLLSEIESR
eukprot:gene9472-10462_t